MDNTEVFAKKQELEAAIVKLLQQFTQTTRVEVEGIDVDRMRILGEGAPKVAAVTVRLHLP